MENELFVYSLMKHIWYRNFGGLTAYYLARQLKKSIRRVPSQSCDNGLHIRPNIVDSPKCDRCLGQTIDFRLLN